MTAAPPPTLLRRPPPTPAGEPASAPSRALCQCLYNVSMCERREKTKAHHPPKKQQQYTPERRPPLPQPAPRRGTPPAAAIAAAERAAQAPKAPGRTDLAGAAHDLLLCCVVLCCVVLCCVLLCGFGVWRVGVGVCVYTYTHTYIHTHTYTIHIHTFPDPPTRPHTYITYLHLPLGVQRHAQLADRLGGHPRHRQQHGDAGGGGRGGGGLYVCVWVSVIVIVCVGHTPIRICIYPKPSVPRRRCGGGCRSARWPSPPARASRT